MIKDFHDSEADHAMSRMRCIGWAVVILAILAILIASLFIMASKVWAAEIDIERLADAIGKAENSVSHPYGIMAHYKKTSPRQACINTINHALKDWNGTGDFILFLQKRYAPLGVKNDPHNLNRNWATNVRYFYGRAK